MVDSGQTDALALTLFSVLLQNLDLDALLAPRKSVFDSAILIGSLITELLKTSLSGTFFSAKILKPWTSSFKASTGLGVLGGFLMPVFNFFVALSKTLISFFRRHFSTNISAHSFPTWAEESLCCATSQCTSFPVAIGFSVLFAKKHIHNCCKPYFSFFTRFEHVDTFLM